MGFFDTVKEKANALASDAGRAGKVTAAQARVVVLQNDVRKAERELGHAAFDLIERGQLEPAGMAEAAARLREARQALSDKEAEIAAIRAAAGDPQAAADATGGSAPAADPTPADEAASGEPAGGGAGADSGVRVAEASAAKKPVHKTAPRKPAAEAPTSKPAAKKAGGASKTGSARTAAKKAGARKTAGKRATRAPARKPAGGAGEAHTKPPATST